MAFVQGWSDMALSDGRGMSVERDVRRCKQSKAKDEALKIVEPLLNKGGQAT